MVHQGNMIHIIVMGRLLVSDHQQFKWIWQVKCGPNTTIMKTRDAGGSVTRCCTVLHCCGEYVLHTN